MKKKPRVLLADDHLIVAEGLRNLLSSEFDLVAIVSDGNALLEAARHLRPDVIVSDVSMPGLSGLDLLPTLRRELPEVKVIFLTMHREAAFARSAIEGGASGYALKHSAPEELVVAIREALKGNKFIAPALAAAVFQSMQQEPSTPKDPASALTPRQKQILQLLAEGQAAKEIAGRLNVSPRTVEFHKYQMMRNLGVENSTALLRFAIKHGIVQT